MLPPGRELLPEKQNKAIKRSGVLLLLFPRQEKLHTCFIRRPDTMRNHAGQIGFPGGRFEEYDKTLINTALRESNEEIGLIPHDVEVLGQLSSLYISVSNFCIRPVVGWMPHEPLFHINRDEVDELLLFSIDEFKKRGVIQVRNIPTATGPLDVPCYKINGEIIWGATAMILTEFLHVIENAP